MILHQSGFSCSADEQLRCLLIEVVHLVLYWRVGRWPVLLTRWFHDLLISFPSLLERSSPTADPQWWGYSTCCNFPARQFSLWLSLTLHQVHCPLLTQNFPTHFPCRTEFPYKFIHFNLKPIHCLNNCKFCSNIPEIASTTFLSLRAETRSSTILLDCESHQLIP